MAHKPAYLATCLQLLTVLAAMPAAANQCVLQDRTVTRTNLEIKERSPVRRDIVSVPEGRRCLVDFKVRVGNEWHTAIGEHTWSGAQSSELACAVAVNRAEDSVRERLGRAATMNEKILVCKDRPELTQLAQTSVGTVADVGQFRPHPAYPNRFWHNGVSCKWFIEPTFRSNDIQNFQGVICELRPNAWTVVDKF